MDLDQTNDPISRRTVGKVAIGMGIASLTTYPVAGAKEPDNIHIEVGAGENGLQFSPDDVVIETGTPVVWEWTGNGGAHNVVSENNSDTGFASELTDEAGYSFSHTFSDPGTYGYVCVPHQELGMSGRVRVEPKDIGARVSVGTGENGFRFESDDVIIKAGTAIVWEWTGDGGAHNVVSDDDNVAFESELTDEEEYIFTHTFDEPGTYEYVCVPHRAQGMSGRVRVEPEDIGARVRVGAGENGFTFAPDDVTIEPDTAVVWEWTGDGGAHNVVSDDDNVAFESELTDEEGYIFTHTFDEQGTYEYACVPHRAQGMSGKISVKNEEQNEPIVDRPESVSVGPGDMVDVSVTVDPDKAELRSIKQELSGDEANALEIVSVTTAGRREISDDSTSVEVSYPTAVARDTVVLTISAAADADITECDLDGTVTLVDGTETNSGSTTIRISDLPDGEHRSGVSRELFEAVDRDGDGDLSRTETQTAVEAFTSDRTIGGISVERADIRSLIEYYIRS